MLGTDVDGTSLLRYVMRWMQEVQSIDDIDRQIGADAGAHVPDCSTGHADEQLRNAGRFP
ncbi:hypothetical protein WS65_19915 [Burkholderia anthina]|nr:hypothetical protein WS65_19915 [Burkholderia anthina]